VHIRCPICGVDQEVGDDHRWRPFCSRRCKVIDLGNWLGEAYRVSRPLRADDVEDEEPARE